jgi:hypothetical protein
MRARKNTNKNEENTVFSEKNVLIATGYRNECLEIVDKIGEFVEEFYSNLNKNRNKGALFGNNEENLKNYVELIERYFEELLEEVIYVNVPLLGNKKIISFLKFKYYNLTFN